VGWSIDIDVLLIDLLRPQIRPEGASRQFHLVIESIPSGYEPKTEAEHDAGAQWCGSAQLRTIYRGPQPPNSLFHPEPAIIRMPDQRQQMSNSC
jgi:hypothetical protein